MHGNVWFRRRLCFVTRESSQPFPVHLWSFLSASYKLYALKCVVSRRLCFMTRIDLRKPHGCLGSSQPFEVHLWSLAMHENVWFLDGYASWPVLIGGNLVAVPGRKTL